MKLKKGKIYKVTFLDHCIGLDRPMRFDCVGFLLRDAEEYILLTSWKLKSKDKSLVDDNHEKSVILKSTIEEVKELK